MGKRQGAGRGQGEEGDDLQNVWLWGGELPRLTDSDHQKSTAGQRGKRDSGVRLRLSGGPASFIGWQNMKCCSDPHHGAGLVGCHDRRLSVVLLDDRL